MTVLIMNTNLRTKSDMCNLQNDITAKLHAIHHTYYNAIKHVLQMLRSCC